MTSNPSDPQSIATAGAEALRAGDAPRARALFQQLVAAGRADASVWLALAVASRAVHDSVATLEALDRVLALQPGNLRALIMKADHLAEAGDARAAAAFYSAALRAAPPAAELPPEARTELRRVQETVEKYRSAFNDHLRQRFAEKNLTPADSGGRFAQSLEILTGRKRIYFQEPLYYFFPELPQVQFYDRQQFQWLDKVEAATDDIRAELLEVLRDDKAFEPYVQAKPNRPTQKSGGMLNNASWSAFFLCKDGTMVRENAARCPRTLEALSDVPLSRILGRTPSILFSLLRAGARIPPHHGMINTRLICHLPLIVPPACGFRVGNEVREWKEGKAWVFDDSIEHEAWNDSDQTRVILLFDVWRPELTAAERDLVAAMFETIDELGGVSTGWQV